MGEAVEQREITSEIGSNLDLLTTESRRAAAVLIPPVFDDNGKLIGGNFSVICIGSSPVSVVHYNSRNIIETWTQLPADKCVVQLADGRTVRAGFLENMYVQYSEGVPGVKIDVENERIWVDTDSITVEQQIQVELDWFVVFENFDPVTNDVPAPERIQEALERYAISRNYAAGLYYMVESGIAADSLGVKGQMTGLYSWGLMIRDQNDQSIIYNDKYFWDGENLGTVAKAILLKAEWQRRFLQASNPNVVMHADEPYLTQVGSTFIVVREVAVLLGSEFSLFLNVGAHCCGKTKYPLLFNNSHLRIAALDLTGEDWDGTWETANFANAFVTSPLGGADINGYLERGGMIALGVIPFNPEITVTQIVNHVERILNELKSKGINVDAHIGQFLITPVCGAGSRIVEEARCAFSYAVLVAKELQQIYGLTA